MIGQLVSIETATELRITSDRLIRPRQCTHALVVNTLLPVGIWESTWRAKLIV